jgi:hypothetical protein
MRSVVDTIQDVQSKIERALECLPKLLSQLPEELKPLIQLAPPQGVHAHVSLRRPDKKASRQIKRNAPASSWSPESDLVLISYDTSAVETEIPLLMDEVKPAEIVRNPEQQQPTRDPARELLQALAQAEMGSQFVSLKWFRDTCLPQRGFSWGTTPEERHRVLADAINRRWILTSRIPNPKNPQFPVTAIRVNRPLDEVRTMLDENAKARPTFAPISIPGERLSETVLGERR